MPWSNVTTMESKSSFIRDWNREIYSFAELCDLYEISRQTGYKLVNRYLKEKHLAFERKTSRPKNSPKKTSAEVEKIIIEIRKKHPTWGSKKIQNVLLKHYQNLKCPHRSTICDILSRHGMVKKRRRRRLPGHPGRPYIKPTAPNQVWCTDFKGQFKTKDGNYCYPLTVTDAYSRYIICVVALPSTHTDAVIRVFRRLFIEFGVPESILSDNGAPFATVGLCRLSQLSVWWLKLGIQPLLIEPGKPQQNGIHERMHRTLKQETTLQPKQGLISQQKCFDKFREEFNNVRPHEGIEMKTPAEVYKVSERPYPGILPKFSYPLHFETRYVSGNSCFKWKDIPVMVSTCCRGEVVGLEEITIGIWNVFLGTKRIGVFHEKKLKIEDFYGQFKRYKLSTGSPD